MYLNTNQGNVITFSEAINEDIEDETVKSTPPRTVTLRTCSDIPSANHHQR